MSDEQMDARLHAAGERWRAAHTSTATADAPAEAAPVADLVEPARRRRWTLFASAAAVAAALVVGGAFVLHDANNGPGPTGDTAALEGHVWLLQDGHGSGSSATLYIDRDGHLVADDECRLIGAMVHVNDSALTVTDQVVRYKSCTDQYGAGYDDVGTAVLDGASAFTLTPDGLTITKNGTDLRFALAPDGTPVPTLDFPTLVGANWLLVSAKDVDGNAVNVAGDPTFLLGDDGSIVGSDGCNSLSGTATTDGNQIMFGPVGGTEKYCPGDRNATETAILDLMKGTAQEAVVGGELTLTKGQAELGYRWNPEPSDSNDPAAFKAVTWHVINNAGTAVPVGATFDGCASNRLDVERGSLRVVEVHSGLTSCHDPGAPLDELLVQAPSFAWSIRAGELYLYVNGAQASALVFTNGTTPPPTNNEKLVGPRWQLTSITFGDTRYRNGAPPGQPDTLTFTGDRYAAKHVCYTNEGDASYAAATVTLGNGHTVDPIPCPFNPDDALEDQAVDAILVGPVTWSIDGGALTITKGTDSLVYSDGTATADNLPLIGTDWRLETAAADSGANYPATGQSFAIADAAAGRVVADDGVNTISGPVDVHSDSLVFGDLSTSAVGSTRTDPVTAIVDQVLTGTVSYRITGDSLTVRRDMAELIYRAHTETGSHSILGSWDLTTIEHGTGPDGSASSASAVGPLVFGASGAANFSECATSLFTATADTVTFSRHWVSDLSTTCVGLGVVEDNYVLGEVLAGTCSYAIDGDQLTVTHDGVGAIVLTRRN